MKIIAFLTVIAVLFGCQHIQVTKAPVIAFCKEAHPMTWAIIDTKATIDEIRSYNAVGARLCGWKAPADVH